MSRKIGLALLVVSVVSMSACRGKASFIDHVAFQPSENLEVVRVSVVFGRNVRSDLAGGFAIKDYGFLFVNPYTASAPFEIGFSLNTSIVNEQEYVDLAPTEVLPNGLPIGLGRALVEVKSPQPVGSGFDLYGYVDVLRASWLGAAAIFSFINDQYFPNGLTLSQTFLRDAEGRPGVTASVFGPSVSGDGTIRRAGGIAFFANVRQLLAQGAIGPNAKPLILYPEAMPTAQGPRAREFQGDPKAMLRLERSLVQAFNQKN